MAWPIFYKNTPNTRNAWGYKFELTDKHMNPEQYEPLKHSYDKLAERALQQIDEISPPPNLSSLRRQNEELQNKKDEETQDKKDEGPQDKKESKPSVKRDLYAILRDHADSDETLGKLWNQVNTVPEWVDWDQIARGQLVFYRYGGPCITGLAYQSLLGGMGAARIVETLARTGGFSTAVARHRLFETTQHVLQCTKSLESIQPGGDGFASTIRVRLLHASVRNRIMKLAETKPEYFDTERWGVPINDIDCVATIATFSSALIWLSLPRQGIYLREDEIRDYVALWRYVGYLIGAPTEGFFEDTDQAKRIFESLLLYEIEPTHTSQILANNIIKSLQDKPPGYASADFLIAGARWLNGNALADALGLPRPSVYYWTLMAGQCIFFCFYCYIDRLTESWDRPKIEAMRKIFWKITLGGLEGNESIFDFKYVPEYNTVTEMGKSEGAKLSHSGVEARNLRTVLIASVVFGVSTWCWVKVCLAGLNFSIGCFQSIQRWL